MEFLLNMNVPRSLGTVLAEHGHSWRHCGDIGLATASDAEIMAAAAASRETIITHDLDYGHLLAFSGDTAPSVIIFRVRNTQASRLAAKLHTAWAKIDSPLREGAIVIIEDAALRIRTLPLRTRD